MSEVFGGNMAFPIHNTGHGAPFDEGMSLRDYFAAKAMQGLCVSDMTNQRLAAEAYDIADAMLIARVAGEQ